jgi:hypothetical protein
LLWQENGCCDKRSSSGEWLTAVCALWKKYETSTMAVRLRHSAVWNMAEVTLTVHHLNTAFWKQWMQTQGNSLRFWNKKCIKWVKKLFHREICDFLGRKFSCAGM